VAFGWQATALRSTLHDKIENKWTEYTDVDGCASYRTDGVAQKYWGKGFHLGNFFPTYDWVADDGYNNFSAWVD
jgi:hypothetical protein